MPGKRVALSNHYISKTGFLRDESGATAIEYALIASLLSIAIVGSAFLLGGGLQGMWLYVQTEVTAGLAAR